ncbi:hypothetical protein F7734_47895 [Scytonema sp. UIC 10036]|nr:hypothetical protein [Scytonema sp. UIC 10036]
MGKAFNLPAGVPLTEAHLREERTVNQNDACDRATLVTSISEIFRENFRSSLNQTLQTVSYPEICHIYEALADFH